MIHLEIGGVYLTKWDKRPYRIIGLDELEVFYDCLWPHDSSWSFSGKFNKKCHFYRTSSQLFAQNAQLQEHQPLTAEEKKFFRPDLIMRIGRIKNASWNSIHQSDGHEFEAYLQKLLDPEFIQQRIGTNEIVVLPYGRKGGFKKGVKLTADNNEYFSLAELIWKSKAVQQSVNSDQSNGIGLYRSGFEQGLPSYYIGEYLDKAGLLKDELT